MKIHSCKNVHIATTRGWEFRKSFRARSFVQTERLILPSRPPLQNLLRGLQLSFHPLSSPAWRGFAGESWASLARHEVPMIASSPGLGISALNGWDAGFAGKLCMNIHSCKNVHIATTRGWEFKKHRLGKLRLLATMRLLA